MPTRTTARPAPGRLRLIFWWMSFSALFVQVFEHRHPPVDGLLLGIPVHRQGNLARTFHRVDETAVQRRAVHLAQEHIPVRLAALEFLVAGHLAVHFLGAHDHARYGCRAAGGNARARFPSSLCRRAGPAWPCNNAQARLVVSVAVDDADRRGSLDPNFKSSSRITTWRVLLAARAVLKAQLLRIGKSSSCPARPEVAPRPPCRPFPGRRSISPPAGGRRRCRPWDCNNRRKTREVPDAATRYKANLPDTAFIASP